MATSSSAFAKASADKAALTGKTLTPSSEDVRIYECCVLYPNNLTQKEEQDLMKEVEGIWSEAQARMLEKDAWGRRGLAYPIKGQTEGKFVVYYFEMDPLKLKEVNHALGIVKNLLRHLIVKPPKHYVVRKWSELYEVWLKERETIDQQRAREREAKLQEKVAAKALRQAQGKREADKMDRRKTEPKVADTEAKKPAMQEEELTKKLEEIISDDSLGNL